MKISELIAALQEALAKYGDLPCITVDDEWGAAAVSEVEIGQQRAYSFRDGEPAHFDPPYAKIT